jgi:hypothetical protein
VFDWSRYTRGTLTTIDVDALHDRMADPDPAADIVNTLLPKLA